MSSGVPYSWIMQNQELPSLNLSCIPCQRLHIQCDHNIPCSNCTQMQQEHQCVESARTSRQGITLISPNPNYRRTSVQNTPSGRVTKNRNSLHLIPPTPIIPSTVNVLPQQFSLIDRLHQEISDRDFIIERLSRSIIDLQNHNSEIMKQVAYYYSHVLRPGILDLGTDLSNDKLLSMKKLMVELLPSRGITSLLKKQFFISTSYVKNIIDTITFEKEHERLWRSLSNQNVTSIDLNFLALLLVILCIGLMSAPHELVLSTEFMDRRWSTKESIDQTCSQWFHASGQILAFHKTKSFMRLQILSLQELFCCMQKDDVTIDQIITQAVYETRVLELSNNKQNGPKLEKLLYWDVCTMDTKRALESARSPFLRCCRSSVPFISNNGYMTITLEPTYPQHTAKLTKIINEVFELDPGCSLSEKLSTAIKIDSRLKEFSNDKFGNMDNKAGRFQKNLIHIQVSIHRYRLFESFLKKEVPIALKVCCDAAKDIFREYRLLKTLFIMGQDPLFIAQVPQLIQAGIIQSTCLLYHPKLQSQDIELIKGDLRVLYKDLPAMRPFNTLSCLEEGLIALKELEKMLIKISESTETSKMNLGALINTGPEEPYQELVNESLKMIKDVSDKAIDRDKCTMEWGRYFYGYLSFCV